MSEENNYAINYIFYLQTKAELDNNYYMLAEVFSKININLLPITADDFRHLDKSNKHYLISIRNDLASSFLFNQMKSDILDSAMARGKISLYDISSFSEIENSAKFYNKNVYRFFQLPLNLKQVAMTIAVDYYRDRNTQVEWPGGRRAKLPSMTNES